jgi:hypothetical protein
VCTEPSGLRSPMAWPRDFDADGDPVRLGDRVERSLDLPGERLRDPVGRLRRPQTLAPDQLMIDVCEGRGSSTATVCRIRPGGGRPRFGCASTCRTG